MCGIAGYWGKQKLSAAVLEKTLNLMRRRGPDSAAYKHWVTDPNRFLYLLHSRLSIIDLDPRSNQPFGFEGNWLSLNGELYNYVELKEDLSKKGHQFHTTSDTEVLVQLLNQNGLDALDRMEGMWAFALYKENSKELWLSRDRFGEKPLYIFEDEQGFYFGSEIKFIQSMLDKPLKVNREAVLRYLVNGYKSLYKKNETFFTNVRELPSGCVQKYALSRLISEERYWAPSYEIDSDMGLEEAIQGVRERILRSVELRLRADVPLAFCMSGGVDSNSLISIAKRIHGYQVHGFTIQNTDARYEEKDVVDAVVAELGLRHTSISMNVTDFLEKLRSLVRHHDAPVYTITYYAQWLLMEAIAKEGYRISISGTGSDELFSGYYDHHLAYLYEVRKNLALFKQSLANWRLNIEPLVRNPHLKNPNLFIDNPNFREHLFFRAEEFGQYLRDPWNEAFEETIYSDLLLRNRMLNEMFHEAVPVILHEDDLNAMYYSIENRSPFLDRQLFEFVNRVPTEHLIQDGYAKSVLRKAMKGIVPDVVLHHHRKVGFNAPIYSFLNPNDSYVREELLKESPIFSILRRDAIEEMIQKESLPNSESKFLFYFLTSKMFLEEFDA